MYMNVTGNCKKIFCRIENNEEIDFLHQKSLVPLFNACFQLNNNRCESFYLHTQIQMIIVYQKTDYKCCCKDF